MTRVAAYLRVSKSDGLDGESNTIETQRRRIKALCEARGWLYAVEYIDDGQSATKKRGEGTAWYTMLSRVGTGEFDVIAALDLDRMLRTMQDLATLLELKAKVATADGEIDLTTADGEFRATMLMAVARFEIRRKTERLERANETRRLKGQPILTGGKILGYTSDGMHQVPDEAKAVKKAFEDFLAGVKITHVARNLTEAGFTTARGRPWGNENIRHLFRQTRYKGVLSKWEADETKRAAGKRLSDDEYPGDFEAIVSADVWEAAQMKLDDPSRRRSWGTSPRYLLTGAALCGRCDDGTKVYTSYYQRTPYTGKDGIARTFEARRLLACLTHKHLSRNAVPVEEFVEDRIVWRLSQPDARELFTPPGDPGIDREALRVERVAVQERFDGLAELAADGVLSFDKVREQSARLRGRLNEIDGLLAPQPSNPGLEVVEAPDVAAAWEALDIELKRIILQVLMTVTILPSRSGAKGFDSSLIRIDWHS
ncbi:recombinase family protein [Streptomyces sp. NPDC048142]|uniref:recombinase family protein n=1 Tax=Streptomyces sp. NPDC048142 TaxID=3365501 RepID=UPI0037209C1A